MKKIEKFYMIVGLCLFLGWFASAVVGFKILRSWKTQNSMLIKGVAIPTTNR
jgi:hypothetical protein